MGGLSQLVTNAVATAKGITSDLQVVVQYEKFIGDEKEHEGIIGRRLYDDSVSYKAVMESRTRFVSIDDGVQGVNISSLQFLDPLAISVRDRITLPDGSRPQIISVEGAVGPNGVYFAPKVLF